MTSYEATIMLNKDFFLCVDGILLKENKFLLIKRNVEPSKGRWALVGGHVDDHETVKDALKREFKEETSLSVDVDKLIGCREEETFDRIKIILTFQVNSTNSEIKLNQESQEYGWFAHTPANSVFNYNLYLNRIKQNK
jgi:8-oxo-dGTP diphosphatase